MCHNLSEIWFVVVAQNKRREHLKMTIFLTFSQLIRHPLIVLFLLSNLLQMPNDYRMVKVEFLGKFHAVVRGSASMTALNWPLLTSYGWPQNSSHSRISFPLQSFLSHHCTVHSLAVPGSNVLLML